MSALMGSMKRQRVLDARIKCCDSLKAYLEGLQKLHGGAQEVASVEKKAIDHGGMVVLGKKNDEEESWGGLSKKKKKGKKKGGKTAKSSTLQHAVIRLSAFSEVRVEPPANAADLAACLATLAAKRSKYEAGELEAEAEPEPEPELKVEQPTEFVNDSSSSPSLAQAHGVEPEQDQDVLDFLDGIKEDDEDDEDGAVAGEANGYGTVAVDLAAEMRKVNEMKAKGLNPDGTPYMHLPGMNLPPPVAMKRNPVTGEMEKFLSEKLKDDLPDEEGVGEGEEIELPCGDDY